MGKSSSKHSSKTLKTDSVKLQNSAQNVPEREQYEIYDPEKYDLEAEQVLRREFKEDPDMFILNMLLMSFMFLEDYQKEIRYLANTVTERGKRTNSRLIKDHQKEMLMPDSVLDSVNKRVKFLVTRGPKKGLKEPLTPQRMYIQHHNIEIEDENNAAGYSRIDKPSYRAKIEESKDNRGFVKVLLDTSRKHSDDSDNRPPSADSAGSASSIKLYRRKSEVVLLNKNGRDDDAIAVVQGTDSGFSTGGNSESSYGYSRITAARTPRILYISEKDMYTNINQLPSKCITTVKVKNEEDSSDSDSDDENNRYRKRKGESDLFRTLTYLNSTEFMSHFKNNIFPNYLGEVLGFTEESIHRAMSIPGAIFCDALDDSCNIIDWEVIPAIPMAWPDKIAFEWTLRRRRTVLDKREKKTIAYKWPTPKMVEEASKLDCVVIPRGFMPKKGENSGMHIEWEVGFPKAERYLEFRMSYAQQRLFLYIIILHKKFIEPLTHQHGLIIEHIRTLMLWECETNYKAWPEDKLGTKLRLVLKSLYECMGKAQLNHYFIKSRNVLENVPRKYLIPAQEVINCILETPLPYAFSALKHLKYMPGKFYPEPDLDELYKIITPKNVFHADAQVEIIAFNKAKQQEEAKRKRNNNNNDKSQKWNRRYLEQQKNANKRKMMANSERQSKNLKTERRESTESINLNFSVKKHWTNEFFRQMRLLTFFIEHFLQIAKRSFKISTTNQTLFYLKQAWYLTKLLLDIDPENALKFQKQIKEDEENCLKKQVTEPKIPSTPKRNSTVFGTDLEVKGKKINIANLSKSYNANVNEPVPSTSAVKKKTQAKQTPIEATSGIKENLSGAEKSRDTSTVNLNKSHNANAIVNESMPSTSGLRKEIKPKQFEVTSSPRGNRTGAEFKNLNEGVEIRRASTANRMVKAVSFRGRDPSMDINITDDEGECTEL